MNEVHLHRGRYPHMTIIDAYVDGQHLTEAVVCPSSIPYHSRRVVRSHPVLHPNLEGRRTHSGHAYRIDSLLVIRRRTDRTSFGPILTIDSHLPPKPELQDRLTPE